MLYFNIYQEDEFADKIKAEPIRENKTAQRELDKLISSLKLFQVKE